MSRFPIVTYGILQSLVRSDTVLTQSMWNHAVQLLILTSDFIAPALWPAKSPDLNPVNYEIVVSCRRVCTAAGFVTLTRWIRTWSRVGTFPTPVHQWSGQAVASTFSSLHSSTQRTFWSTDFKYVWYLHKRRLYTLTVTCLSGCL